MESQEQLTEACVAYHKKSIAKLIKGLERQGRKVITPETKFWGWKDGVFGNPLPKSKFKTLTTAPGPKKEKPKIPEHLKKYERMNGPEALEYWQYKYWGMHKERFEVVEKEQYEKEQLIKKALRVAPELEAGHPEKEIKIKKTYLGNKIFIGRLEGGIYDMSMKSLQNPTLLLLYLLQHQTFPGKVDKHHTWTKWYLEKELIVASRGEEKMAVDLEVNLRTIQRWSAALERDGAIVKCKEGRETVYILGRIMGQDKLYLYSGGTRPDKIKLLIGDKSVV